jgi:hypothetical protein
MSPLLKFNSAPDIVELEMYAMLDSLVEQLKGLRCAPCKDEYGLEKLAHIVWFIKEDELTDETFTLPLCLECAEMVFSRFDKRLN